MFRCISEMVNCFPHLVYVQKSGIKKDHSNEVQREHYFKIDKDELQDVSMAYYLTVLCFKPFHAAGPFVHPLKTYFQGI